MQRQHCWWVELKTHFQYSLVFSSFFFCFLRFYQTTSLETCLFSGSSARFFCLAASGRGSFFSVKRKNFLWKRKKNCVEFLEDPNHPPCEQSTRCVRRKRKKRARRHVINKMNMKIMKMNSRTQHKVATGEGGATYGHDGKLLFSSFSVEVFPSFPQHVRVRVRVCGNLRRL